jgi:hypothetical protein
MTTTADLFTEVDDEPQPAERCIAGKIPEPGNVRLCKLDKDHAGEHEAFWLEKLIRWAS